MHLAMKLMFSLRIQRTVLEIESFELRKWSETRYNWSNNKEKRTKVEIKILFRLEWRARWKNCTSTFPRNIVFFLGNKISRGNNVVQIFTCFQINWILCTSLILFKIFMPL